MLLGVSAHLGCLKQWHCNQAQNWCSESIYLMFPWDSMAWFYCMTFKHNFLLKKKKKTLKSLPLVLASNRIFYNYFFIFYIHFEHHNFNLSNVLSSTKTLIFCTWLWCKSSVAVGNITTQPKQGRHAKPMRRLSIYIDYLYILSICLCMQHY